ncbi:DUF3866 family protein [Brevibacillus ruminantium]|uniref:DUF3866 family protein n=1 Tax=Brevibacillus ruminantium TaxID=2950604 RepID=A0ABY4W8U5_9BACL|nr:DUF3866 family protein [Brevibacillus ruminantium]USG63606.1 DUF3866 family protein [Brevibacillus ruminantium]
MLRLEFGVVKKIVKQNQSMQVVEVLIPGSGLIEQAISYAREQYQEGDVLLLNTTAVRLQLGTGGYHIVVGKCGGTSGADVYPSVWGHAVKMRYSPWQIAVDAVEEQQSPYHALFLDEEASLSGTPVVIGELHSMLPAVAAAIKHAAPHLQVVYVMPDAASLPLGLSHQVDHLQKKGIVNNTITTGHAWGGEWESITIHTGLLAARLVAKADIILCILGPGVAGTGTPFGFSGMELAEVIHATSLLGGTPFFIPRISFSDPRERHLGVSHHTVTLLKRFTLRPVLLPLPIWNDERDIHISAQLKGIDQQTAHLLLPQPAPIETELEVLERKYSLHFSTMGRNWRQDPSPFQAAVLAGRLAAQCIAFLKEKSNDGQACFSAPDILAALGLFLTRSGA